MFLQDGEGDNRKNAFVRRCQNHRRRHAIAVGAQPVHGCGAPAVSRNESWEPELGDWGDEVVADAALMSQELRRHHRADRVAAAILGTGVARPIAKEASEGISPTRLQGAAQDVALAHCCSIAQRASRVNECSVIGPGRGGGHTISPGQGGECSTDEQGLGEGISGPYGMLRNMATTDVDFFFDPMCPWAWITSRWVTEVTAARGLRVHWRFLSLHLLNSDRDYERDFPPGYFEVHVLGLRLLRVAAAVRSGFGDGGVGRFYRTVGTRIHVHGRQDELGSLRGVRSALASAGLPQEFAGATEDDRYDELVAEETALALARAGAGVGTPVLTFAPPNGPSFFGPVVSRIPRGEEALQLWDATERIARFPGFAELKRAVRESPQVR